MEGVIIVTYEVRVKNSLTTIKKHKTFDILSNLYSYFVIFNILNKYEKCW